MEKICEFCATLRPVVYCKSDAAHLCLSCDAKVHSANALSNRHFRTLLCDLCRYRPAYVRCLDHRMFMCRGCDQSQHEVSSQHQKWTVGSYTGCPSAKDFGAWWGFELSEPDNIVTQNKLFSTSYRSVDSQAGDRDKRSSLQIGGSSGISTMSSATLITGAKSEGGSSSQQTMMMQYESQQQQNTSFILQQILDLKRLQLTEENDPSPSICQKEQTDISTSVYKSANKLVGYLEPEMQYSEDLGSDPQQTDGVLAELKVEATNMLFAEPENSISSATVGFPSHGDSYWQCKSPVQSSQMWSLNMQDLGVCEDIVFHDDFNIPDVDLTFRNFEELFGGDQDPIRALLGDEDVPCSFGKKGVSFDKSDDGNARGMEATSVSSSVYKTLSHQVDKETTPSNPINRFLENQDFVRPIRPSYSTLSFSLSRFSAESSGTDCLDSAVSPNIRGGETSCSSLNLERAQLQARENTKMRYKEKKARLHEKQSRYLARKARANKRKQVKGQSVKTEGYDSDINVTRSY